MFVKKSSGSLHYVNTTLYQKLEENYFICENDNVYLCEDKINKEIENHPFYKMIIQAAKDNGYQFKPNENEKNYQWIEEIIKQAEQYDNLPNDGIKNMVKDYLTNNNMIGDNQPIQNQEELTSDQNNEEETQQIEEPKEKEPISQGTEQQKQQVRQYVNDVTEAYIKIIKKSGCTNEILKAANEKSNDKEWKKLENVPTNILLDCAKRNQDFVKFLLNVRLENGIKSLNISDNQKKEMMAMFSKDIKSKNEILRIIGWTSQKNNEEYSVFDFPVTQYYYRKYQKSVYEKAFKTLAKGISDVNNGKWTFGDDAVKELIDENNLEDIKDEKQAYNKLKKLYSNDFMSYIINYNNKFSKHSFEINNASANDIAELLVSKNMVGDKVIKDVEMILRNAMYLTTLIPFIDYIMDVDYDSSNVGQDSESDENYAIKITMFNNFSPSSILQKARDYIKENDSKYEIEGLKPKISAFFSDIYDTAFKNIESGDICKVRFVKGFPLLSVITKNIKDGYNKGRNFKGIIGI